MYKSFWFLKMAINSDFSRILEDCRIRFCLSTNFNAVVAPLSVPVLMTSDNSVTVKIMMKLMTQ